LAQQHRAIARERHHPIVLERRKHFREHPKKEAPSRYTRTP
jgi:hypothetical protein